MKHFNNLFEQKSIRVGQHPVQQVERNSKELYKMRVLQAEWSGNSEVILSKKEQVGYCKVTLLQGMAGVSQAGYVTNADQLIPD